MRTVQAVAMSFLLCLGAGAALAQIAAPEDERPVNINGTETVCTGTTTDVRDNPLWRDYSLRLEFAGKDGQYLGDEQVTVSGNGRSVSVRCKGPWVLMRLPPGSYRVAADVAEGGHRDITVRVPGRTIVRFPEAGGVVAPPQERQAAR